MNWLQKTWTRMFGRNYEILEQEEQMKSEEWLDNRYERINLFYTKRYAETGNKIPLKLNVCDFLKPMISLKEDATLNKIWNENITYVSDNFAVNNVLDYWQFAVETNTLRKGDCEDSSIYRVSKAKSNGLGYNLFVAFGLYRGSGHAFPVIVDYKNNRLVILEATSSTYNPIYLSSGAKSDDNYNIYYLTNARFSWVLDNSIIFGKGVNKDFGLVGGKYDSRIKNKRQKRKRNRKEGDSL